MFMCLFLSCFSGAPGICWQKSREILQKFGFRGLQGTYQTYLGPATTQNLVVKFDGEICGGVLVENASDDFSPAKEARKSPSKLRRKFATNFAENFANFTLGIAGAYLFAPTCSRGRTPHPTGEYPDPKVRVCAPFSCLTFCRPLCHGKSPLSV